MSKYVVNQKCDICHHIEKAVCRMHVGDTTHYICYDCMSDFVWDLAEFASVNLSKEIGKLKRGRIILEHFPNERGK